jgi:hypothetical protein
MTTKPTPAAIKARMENAHKRHTSLHPTVDAKGYEIISAPAPADGLPSGPETRRQIPSEM